MVYGEIASTVSQLKNVFVCFDFGENRKHSKYRTRVPRSCSHDFDASVVKAHIFYSTGREFLFMLAVSVN